MFRQETSTEQTVGEKEVVASPLTGKVVPLTEVKDEAFSGELLGKGVAIDPTEGTVVAPCDGTVTVLFPTKHAIGITLGSGVELLIHAGIDTVKMEGEGFELYVDAGDQIKKGDKLLSFDMNLVKEKGYQTQTMFLVADANGKTLEVTPAEKADNDQKIMTLK